MRFPEHYKSLYHLAHFYCKSKRNKNITKVAELLLGQGGLFSDRHSKNFFNVCYNYFLRAHFNFYLDFN